MRSKRAAKRNPTHPGEVLCEDVLPALDMTQAELATPRREPPLLSELLLEKRGMSADMAVRLARLTNTTPESWLRMQEALDLWELERDPKRYRNIAPIAA